jgi:hypothetical protein
MPYVMLDVEADGPIPGDFSMICFAAVIVREPLDQKFYGRLKPISEKWDPAALAASGFSREDTLTFAEPAAAMLKFKQLIAREAGRRVFFISDNNGFLVFLAFSGSKSVWPFQHKSGLALQGYGW